MSKKPHWQLQPKKRRLIEVGRPQVEVAVRGRRSSETTELQLLMPAVGMAASTCGLACTTEEDALPNAGFQMRDNDSWLSPSELRYKG